MTPPPPEFQIGDYICSTLVGWEQGTIVKIHPPVTKFNIVLYDVLRPDGAAFRIARDYAAPCGFTQNQLAAVQAAH